MHMWIVLAAFAFAAVTPFISAPQRSDVAQMQDDLGDEHAAGEGAEDDRDA